MIIFIGAYAQNYAMGKDGHLPWRNARLKSDTKRLHKLANRKTIVTGERTYHDYKDIRAAFATNQVVVVSNIVKSLPDARVVNTIQEIIELGKTEELWVIGGGSVFTQLLPYADKMYLTRVEAVLEGDVFFPKYSLDKWKIVAEEAHEADEDNPYPYTFLELCKK